MENKMDVTILPRTEDLVAWLVWLVIVIFFLLRDVVKAYMRRAFCFPGRALVLSALIIQLLPFVDYSNISVYSRSSYEKKEVSASLVINQLVIDSGRLMMYVLIAYLLPGMARSGSTSDAIPLAVLALILTSQLKVEKRSGSTILILAMFIYLLWLLMRAFMVGRSIRRIMSQKIPSALSCRTPDDVPRVHPTEYHVHKCWIVARLSQPDYVLARSGFCSMVCRIVTACIVLHVIKWRHVQFTDNESRNSVTQRKLVLFVIVGQFVIVLIGWIVLFFRGWISVLHRDISSGDYLNSVSMEDALTDLAASFLPYFCNDKRIQEQKLFQLFPVRLVQKLSQFLTAWFVTWPWVQKLVQFLTAWFVPIATDNEADFPMYRPILSKLQIGGEREQSLWEANQQGFSRVIGKMDQGRKAARRSALTGLLRGAGGGRVGRVKELLQDNKNSWKRTAVSLIHLMIYDKGHDYDIREAMAGYTQAWEYMHFVDGLNVEVKSLGWKTDEEFDHLQDTWNKPEMLQSEIRVPLFNLINCTAQERDDLQNSRDSAKVAKYCLLQTYEHREQGELRDELANVYLFCMTEDLNKTILEKCCKLAEEGREEEILDLAFLAAKVQGLLDKVRERNDRENPVELPDNTDQGSDRSSIQTEDEESNLIRRPNDSLTDQTEIAAAGKGKGQAELQSIELIESSDAAAGEGKGQPELPPIAPAPPPMGAYRRPPITSLLPTETATVVGKNDQRDPAGGKEGKEL